MLHDPSTEFAYSLLTAKLQTLALFAFTFHPWKVNRSHKTHLLAVETSSPDRWKPPIACCFRRVVFVILFVTRLSRSAPVVVVSY